MGVSKTLVIDSNMIMIVGGVVLVVYLYSQKQKIIAAVNPANKQNVINKGFSGLVQKTTGRKSLGHFIYCKFHSRNDPVCRPGT